MQGETGEVFGGARLRHVFVSMLFALVVGQLASASYDVFSGFTVSKAWFLEASAQLSHLFVALIMITASWVGWSKTFELPSYPRLDGLFSRGYVLLIIDVVILILYFSMVKSVEKPGLINASARSEVTLIMLVFWSYVIWDLVFSQYEWKYKLLEALPSFLCAVSCVLILNSSNLDGYTEALSFNAVLIGILLCFRGLKSLLQNLIDSQLSRG